MGKKDYGKFKKKEQTVTGKKNFHSEDDDMFNDEIDAFNKERNIVPLDVNEDTEESDEDAEHPVFDLEDEDDDEDELEEDDKPVKPDRGMAAKIVRTQKYLKSRFGDLEDETLDDEEEEEQGKPIWGRKEDLYGGNTDHETGSSDEVDPAEAEEEEVLRLQRERADALSEGDYGIEDDDAVRDPTFEEILDGCKPPVNGSLDKVIKEDAETVKKDLSTLTKEEQMDIVYSSAPELVGLLSELNDALDQLENKVNPLLDTFRERESSKKGGVANYLEVKQLLLQSFCQAITFYLLLKSEGHEVRDHPVVSRLVEIKSLLDKMKEMDENLPFDFEDIIRKDASDKAVTELVEKKAAEASDSLANGQIVSEVSLEKLPAVEPKEAAELNGLKKSKKIKSQDKPQDTQAGVQSMEMMKVRADLEEKLKQKGVYRSIASKNVRVRENSQPVNRQMETLDDFDDEATGIDGVQNDGSNILRQLTSQSRKRKVISGDADIPKRDDLGERRRKHELRVLAGAGINSFDDTGDADNVDSDDSKEQSDSDSDDLYEQVERQHAAKLAAKSDKYSRTPEIQYLDETTADGKRHITNQIEKNRGLTRARKKLIKNPRKKYRVKHDKQAKNRRGQVRDVIKPTRPYGGETSGINTNISRSVRFKG